MDGVFVEALQRRGAVMKYILWILIAAAALLHASGGMLLATFPQKEDAEKAAGMLHDVLADAGIDVGTEVVVGAGGYEVRTTGALDDLKRRRVKDAMEDYFHPVTADDAVALFEKSRYEEAYSLLQQLRLEQLDDPRLNFYLGRSAFELGKFDEALALFDELIKQEEGNTRLQLEHARTLYMLQSYDKARDEFAAVLKTPLPPAVRANVERYLGAIDAKTKRHIFSGAVIVGGGYDDNVYNHTYLGTTPYAQTVLDNNTSHVPDAFHREIVSLNYLYVFESRKWAWDTALLFFNRDYNVQNSVNVMQPGIVTGPRYYSGSSRYYLPVTYNYLWYGGNAFMQSAGTRPEYNRLIDDKNAVDAAAVYLRKRFIQETDKDRNANRFGLTAGWNHLFGTGALLRGQAGVIGERRTQGNRKDVSFNMLSLEARYSQGLWKNGSIYTIGRMESYRYTENDPNLPDRADTRYRVEADISQKLGAGLSLEARYTYTRAVSTINLYSFSKNVATLNLLATF